MIGIRRCAVGQRKRWSGCVHEQESAVLRVLSPSSPSVLAPPARCRVSARVLCSMIVRPRTPPGVDWSGWDTAHSGGSVRPYSASPLLGCATRSVRASQNGPSNSARRRAARPHLLSSTVPEPRHRSCAVSHPSQDEERSCCCGCLVQTASRRGWVGEVYSSPPAQQGEISNKGFGLWKLRLLGLSRYMGW